MTANENYMTNWQSLPFRGFRISEEKLNIWYKYAIELVESLKLHNNTGLIGETGTGKTIITLLAFEALKVRTIFFVPTVILAKQHADLYKKITGVEAMVITGQSVSAKLRDWEKAPLIFATPHVFMVDYEKGLIEENNFDLFIFDEMHKGQGDYPYVPITKLAKLRNKNILALSASPAGSIEGIDNIEKTYGVKKWVVADIEMPTKKSRLLKVEPSLEMKEAGHYLSHFYLKTLEDLNNVFIRFEQDGVINCNEENPFSAEENHFLTQDDNNALKKKVDNLKKPEIFTGYTLYAKLMKIAYMYRLIMTESYVAFIDYFENYLSKDHSRAGAQIFANENLKMIYLLIKGCHNLHPKELALQDLVREMVYKNKNMLVFVGSKKTGYYLAEHFNRLGYSASTLFGGIGKSVKKNAKTIEDFNAQKIKIIFATSVVEEGLSLPEIDVVIHYNQPLTEITRLQRGGRTGRFREGLVVFIVTNIAYELAIYFATLAKLKKMQQIFYESARQEFQEKKKAKKIKKREITGQIEIDFPPFFSDLPF